MKKPHLLFWTLIPVILVLHFIWPDATLDLFIQNRVIVIQAGIIEIAICVFLAAIGGLYFLVRNKNTIRWITNIHSLSTILTVVVLLLLALRPGTFSMLGTVGLMTLTIVTAITQLLFLVNVLWGFRKV